MVEGPPEVLVREYRGYRYVAEDLFADDAPEQAEEGWHTESAEWTVEKGNVPEALLSTVHVLTGGYLGQPRQEYLLRVTYHREPACRDDDEDGQVALLKGLVEAEGGRQ